MKWQAGRSKTQKKQSNISTYLSIEHKIDDNCISKTLTSYPYLAFHRKMDNVERKIMTKK